VLVARESTERGEGIAAGTLELVGTDPATIVAEVGKVLADPSGHRLDPADNPYGDGRAAERIVAAAEYFAGIGPPPVRFGPPFSRKVVFEAAGYDLTQIPKLEPRGVQPDRSEEQDRWVGR